jgi:deazaflavin-dependent oxidoreductase (nitroreductase family)
VLTRSQADQDFCYLTTRGRVSGKPRTIEIWFAGRDSTIYFLSGGGDASNWVKNVQADPDVSVRIGRKLFKGKARLVADKDEGLSARHLLAGKYEGWEPGKRLSSWARTSLPVAVDLGA